jgi:hypothetical protein
VSSHAFEAHTVVSDVTPLPLMHACKPDRVCHCVLILSRARPPVPFATHFRWGDNSYNCENSTGMCANTPNLDALASSPHTALFHRFYSAAGVCSPTRYSKSLPCPVAN